MLSKLEILLCVIFCLSVFKCATSTDRGTQCTQTVCVQNRGYIEYRGPAAFAKRSWNIRSQFGQYTTFVLRIKNVQVPHTFWPWLGIYQFTYPNNAQVFTVQTAEERILVFRNTNGVAIALIRSDFIQFDLEFYVGCEVIEDGDVTIRHDPQPQFLGVFQATLPTPTCWIVFPTIREETERTAQDNYLISIGLQAAWRARYVEVEQSYLTLQNVTLGDNTAIHVSDLISGDDIMTSEEDEILSVSSLDKSNKTVQLTSTTHRVVSTVIFVDLTCENPQGCKESDFAFTSYALRRSDLDCIERERRCRFNIGERDFDCSPPPIPPSIALLNSRDESFSNTNCPAFDIIFSSLLATIDENEPVIPAPIARLDEPRVAGLVIGADAQVQARSFALTQLPGISQTTFNRCTATREHYLSYCGNRKCIYFKRNYCAKVCFSIRHTYKLCDHIHTIF